jgi:diaminohydroxyphosphoribosylaminopyrimidine deaminase/5-amino-6-(5-phosphoribosylamino)uracil reductase
MHAEPAAIADARGRGEDVLGATAYVTLEPCCHVKKRTPPCVPALISVGVKRVVLGCLDPNPEVDGKGVAQLRSAGVEVVTGVLEAECCQLIAPFTARAALRRPYVTLKWAQSFDGLIAGAQGARRQISGEAAGRVVHWLRGRCEAIVVGGQTLRTDDPLLTARPTHAGGGDVSAKGGEAGVRRLLRCVVSQSGKLPVGSRLFSTPGEGETVVYRGSLAEMLGDLYERGVTHVLVESGGALAKALDLAGLADRAWVFSSPERVGEAGVRASRLDWAWTGTVQVGRDTLTELINPMSPLFFAPEPSADFVAVTHMKWE